jgi:hypothetical protein
MKPPPSAAGALASRFVMIVMVLMSFYSCLAHADEVRMDVGALSKFARDTGMPAKAILIGPMADYMHKELGTEAAIYAESEVVRKIDSKCNRYRIKLNIPELIVSARNPTNPDDIHTGPFEAVIEMNLCS